MDADIYTIHERLHSRYPIILSSSLELGFKSKTDFPVLHGQSVLGRFELVYDGVSFPFYVKDGNGEVTAHFHLQTLSEAEKTVIDFMEGNLTIIPFGQPHDI